MLKIVSADSWANAMWDEESPRSVLIKRSSRGIIDKASLIKHASASSAEFLSQLDSLDVHPEGQLIHMNAVGTTEAYGPNRNGDGFSKAACQKYHPYFVKEARFYRDHKHDDKSKSYGVVKASAFNDEMQRIELIVELNATPKVAAANGGLLADKEMDALERGKDIPVSMACSVPFDLCSVCGNKAIRQSDYCRGTHEGGSCPGGGLKHNMGKIAKVKGELRQLYADNTEPKFFDISHVFVPADRIAYSSGRLTKSAGVSDESRYLSGAELARQLCLTEPEDRSLDAQSVRALGHLKSAVSAFHSRQLWEKRASFLGVMNAKPLTDTQFPKRYKFAEVQRALQDLKVCLTPTQFVQLISDMPVKEASLVGEIIAPLSNDVFEKAAEIRELPLPASAAPQALYQWAFSQHLPSVDPKNFFKQAALASVTDAPEATLNTADIYALSADPYINKLAESYALYKAAFVASLPAPIQETASDLLVGRDYLSF